MIITGILSYNTLVMPAWSKEISQVKRFRLFERICVLLIEVCSENTTDASCVFEEADASIRSNALH